MKPNENIQLPNSINDKRQLFITALQYSFQFYIQELDCSKSIQRVMTNKLNFLDALNFCCSEKSHWSIIYRYDSYEPYYEFCVSTLLDPSIFVYIFVNPESFEQINLS